MQPENIPGAIQRFCVSAWHLGVVDVDKPSAVCRVDVLLCSPRTVPAEVHLAFSSNSGSWRADAPYFKYALRKDRVKIVKDATSPRFLPANMDPFSQRCVGGTFERGYPQWCTVSNVAWIDLKISSLCCEWPWSRKRNGNSNSDPVFNILAVLLRIASKNL